MKQKIYFIGLGAVMIMATGAIFKVNHWPGAGIMISTGTLILVLVFLPAALVNNYKAEGSSQNRLLYIVTWITCFVVFTAMLFKIQHWPYAGYAMLIGIPFPYVVFLPVFISVTAKNRNFNIYNTVFVLLLLAINSVFSALLALNVSKETLTDSYTISRNYSGMESAIADLKTNSGSSSVNMKIDEVIKIANDYQDLILKHEGITREQWKKSPDKLERPDNANVTAGILTGNGDTPAGTRLYKTINELIVLMQQTRGYEETARVLPAIIGTPESGDEDPVWSFSSGNFLIPLYWSLTYLEGLKANLLIIKATGK